MNWKFSIIDNWSYSILDFRKMTRIGDRSIGGDHGLKVDKFFLANDNNLELGVYLVYDL